MKDGEIENTKNALKLTVNQISKIVHNQFQLIMHDDYVMG